MPGGAIFTNMKMQRWSGGVRTLGAPSKETLNTWIMVSFPRHPIQALEIAGDDSAGSLQPRGRIHATQHPGAEQGEDAKGQKCATA